ncbi:Hypothetical predicted protein [Marmota monax]|uniref:HAP1 N-terminal domain-containing protein n=1 Tax=Marmota monax TaxID=9995 RepID=A0A5E4AQ77_MARMO|nr:Hypothetical predicted protein [Marmota monax]
MYPAEASQQMAELSEVLVLRLENYERQQKEITQLQAQIAKLQQRCQSPPSPCARLMASTRPNISVWVLVEMPENCSSCPLTVQGGDHGPLRDSPRPHESPTLYVKGCQTLPDVPGRVGWGACAWHGETLVGLTGSGFLQYGAETEKLQHQLASEKGVHVHPQEEDLREKYADCGGVLFERPEEVKTLRQHAVAPPGSVTHYAYTVPLGAIPNLPQTLAEELRTSLRRIISDPAYFMGRYDPRYREERKQEQEFEAEQGLMPAENLMPPEDFEPAEELVPEEELGATEEVGPAEEGLSEDAELVSEDTEAWEEVEPEVDEATRMNVVTSALEASGLGPSRLDMKYVLQQLANWQDAHYRRQLRQKMRQKEELSRDGLPPTSRTSCRSSSR